MVPTITVASEGLNSILKLATELGRRTPFDGTTKNYVNLKMYWSGFELGLKMVNGNSEIRLMGQKPKSCASGMDTSTSFLCLVIL